MAIVKCKECGGRVSTKADACHSCGAKVKKWRLLKIVLLTIIGFPVLLGVIGSLVSKSGDGRGSPTVASQAPPTAPMRNIVEISAQALYDDYERNEVAADERYRGALLKVTGTVVSIDKNFTNSIVLWLKAGGDFDKVMLSVPDSEKAIVSSLQKGQEITAFCDSVRRILTSPSASKCTIVSY
jgi:hypothetical protein